MLSGMPDAMASGHAFAVQNEEQYRPAETVADQHVLVRSDDGAEGVLPCHASRPFDAPATGIERLLVVVHGALRDSHRYFAHARAAAGDDGPATLIVAPQFLASVDHRPRDNTLYWDVEGWKGGQAALGPAPISSFAAMDSLLQQLTEPGMLPDARPDVKPDAKKLSVVIVGNSAGGQYVNRYAAVGRAPDELAERGIRVRFIVANPSTYLYFDRERPVTVPDDPSINRWRYGFEDAPAYVNQSPRESLARYLARDVTIVLGAEDRDDAALLLEVSAAAMAQGANRLQRGIYYDQHVRRLAQDAGLAARHRVVELAGVGHAANDVLSAPQTREIMFG